MIRISRARRNALYRVPLVELKELDLLRELAGSRDPERIEECEEIGRRMVDVLRLIQDGGIGWGNPDGNGPHELTLPPEELRRIIEVEIGSLASLEETFRAERDEFDKPRRRMREGREACNSILDQLRG
ncbi:MAG: hypothetical protein ACTHKT_14375 [Solirubrobacterales bacterium]